MGLQRRFYRGEVWHLQCQLCDRRFVHYGPISDVTTLICLPCVSKAVGDRDQLRHQADDAEALALLFLLGRNLQ